MNEQFLNYSQSLALKELGFDEQCLGYYTIYSDGEVKLFTSDKGFRNLEAPLIQQAFKFFRDKYKLCSWVYQTDDNKFFYTILDVGRFIIAHEQSLKDYENAEQECLNKLIDVVRTRLSFFKED